LTNKLTRGVLGAVGAAAAVLSAAFAVGAAPAHAADCAPPPAAVQPFLPWQDSHDYVLATGGSFEPAAPAWTLTGGAAVVAANAPNALDPAGAANALYLPPGSSATSACLRAPHIVGIVRFFAKNAGVDGGKLRVELLANGRAYDAGVVTAGADWAPTPILSSNAPGTIGANTLYQVRLTPLGPDSAFTVDDVYVDPYHSR
jgi:hypothetical protein